MKKKILILNLIILLFFSISINAAEQQSMLKIRALNRPITLNPTQAAADISVEITNQIFENLLSVDQNGNLKAELADSWQISDGGRKLTFDLKENIYFQKEFKGNITSKNRGREVRAEDWKWSLNYLASPENRSPYRELLKDIKGYQEFSSGESEQLSGIRTEGKYRLIIELKRSNTPFLYNLAHHAAVVMPKEDVLNPDRQWSLNPVGSGAFAFENIDSESLTLKRNNNYWQKDDQDRALPYLEGIKYYLEAGEEKPIDYFSLYKLNSDQYGQFLAGSLEVENYNFKKIAADQLKYYGIVFNKNNSDLLAQAKFREFLNYAVDRQEIIENLALNDFLPAKDFLTASNKKLYSYNPEKAEKIIEDYNLNSNFTIQLAVNKNSVNQKIAEEVKKQLLEYGIEIELEKRNWVNHLNFKTESNHQSEYLLAKSSNIADPYNFLYQNFHSDNLSSDSEYKPFTNSRLDNFLDYIKIEVEQENRERALALIKDIVIAETPLLYLFQSAESYLIDERIRNIDKLDNYFNPPEYKRLYFEK
ncbi:ABC transporter substrate-binding protein [Halanaerobium sp. Z-7514]|uniref:ABC transporter substrate-binding protein n=1 Tax=Halanaerobium polyolivorans TaxID=2886943 RepID=A0AAW4X152_9FIRM|nr:ABC transporter substrate-binding protein [Halanaerobium polyolivorans]MCC3145552.1 ABC transporter substrate-binding protein [Halanaerobium polyolivorans]